jgi:hypothetical protein
MSRSDKLLEVLEGFKLGSLGAGKLKVTEPEQMLKILEKQDHGDEESPAFVYWHDIGDAIRYCLFVSTFIRNNKNRSSTVCFVGGKRLEIQPEEWKPSSKLHDLSGLGEVEMVATYGNLSYKEAEDELQTCINLIKSNEKQKLDKYIYDNFLGRDEGFFKWYKIKKKQLGVEDGF